MPALTCLCLCITDTELTFDSWPKVMSLLRSSAGSLPGHFAVALYLQKFRRCLKTHLFQHAYNHWEPVLFCTLETRIRHTKTFKIAFFCINKDKKLSYRRETARRSCHMKSCKLLFKCSTTCIWKAVQQANVEVIQGHRKRHDLICHMILSATAWFVVTMHYFWHTATFTVHVPAHDLVKSSIFDTNVEIKGHVRFLIRVHIL